MNLCVKPLVTFGDGVPHQVRKSVECITWALLATGNQGRRYLFTCIPKDFCCKCGCAGRLLRDFEIQVEKRDGRKLLVSIGWWWYDGMIMHILRSLCSGRHTIEALLSVFVWSCTLMLENMFPDKRHDGSAWLLMSNKILS